MSSGKIGQQYWVPPVVAWVKSLFNGNRGYALRVLVLLLAVAGLKAGQDSAKKKENQQRNAPMFETRQRPASAPLHMRLVISQFGGPRKNSGSPRIRPADQDDSPEAS